MGMSASQARYLSLCARQTDLEFQGQQINQSRTTLSDQVNNLYAQLQNMSVPIPPSTQDYTNIVYTTTDGPVDWKLGTIRPSTKKEGAYNVDMGYSTVGASLQMSNTASSISYSDPTIAVTSVSTTELKGTGDIVPADEGETPEFYLNDNDAGELGSELIAEGEDISDYVMLDPIKGWIIPKEGEDFNPDATYRRKISVDEYNNFDGPNKAACTGYVETKETVSKPITVNSADLPNYYIEFAGGSVEQLSADSNYVTKNNDGSFTISNLPTGAKLYQAGGNETINNPKPNELTIGGVQALTFDEAQDRYEGVINWNEYEAAVRNSFGDDTLTLDAFYFVITPTNGKVPDVKLYRKEDIPNSAAAEGMNVKGYTYATGTYTETENYDYVDIKFDSSGRITKITIPTKFDAEGNPCEWKELDVVAKTETDNFAYEQAMNDYEYEKYLYDQEQTEINAQMSIIQAQDKKLELKLQRLDNERTQITTEMEALEKVIGDNIEATYKTFSG